MFCPANTTLLLHPAEEDALQFGSSHRGSTDQPSAMIKGWRDRTRDFFRFRQVTDD